MMPSKRLCVARSISSFSRRVWLNWHATLAYSSVADATRMKRPIMTGNRSLYAPRNVCCAAVSVSRSHHCPGQGRPSDGIHVAGGRPSLSISSCWMEPCVRCSVNGTGRGVTAERRHSVNFDALRSTRWGSHLCRASTSVKPVRKPQCKSPRLRKVGRTVPGAPGRPHQDGVNPGV
eukprot:362816-Chlamydomonas_euryale.AAC.3